VKARVARSSPHGRRGAPSASCGARPARRRQRRGIRGRAPSRSPRRCSACRSPSSSRTACRARQSAPRPVRARAYVAWGRAATSFALARRALSACRSARLRAASVRSRRNGRARARARREPGRRGAQREAARGARRRRPHAVPRSPVVHQAGRGARRVACAPPTREGRVSRGARRPVLDDVAGRARATPTSSSRGPAPGRRRDRRGGRAALLVPFPTPPTTTRQQRRGPASAGGAVCLGRAPPTSPARRARSAPPRRRRAPRAPWPTRARCLRQAGRRGDIAATSARARASPPREPTQVNGAPASHGGELMFRGRVRHVHFVGVGGIGMSGSPRSSARSSSTSPAPTSSRTTSRGVSSARRPRPRSGTARERGGADVVVYSSAIARTTPRSPAHARSRSRSSRAPRCSPS
jgi:hypothetical protein